ncbi:MAG: hypothetical protein JSW47_19935 [Phycisphaerales bacterium]|nr:MAG: hypothetical protein JSW47_19935 [Phycisphaerales bacterium]UCF14246.1 MAG: hypothetical protein JSW59_12600 [Phycisphaerales bacterium]
MGQEGAVEPAQIEDERRTRVDWNIWDALISLALVVFIIIVPLGGLEYLNGRFNTHTTGHSFFLDACIIGSTVLILAVAFVIGSTVQLLCNLKRYTRRKKLIRIIQIGTPVVFVTSLIVSVLTPVEIPLWQPGYKPFTYGFRERIRSKADIKDIRGWLKTLSREDCTGEYIGLSTGSSLSERRWPDSPQWPNSLKVFRPGYVTLDLDEDHNPRVRLTWGGPSGHWGVEIGMEEMDIRPSDSSPWEDYRLRLEPGAYVWHELQ